MSESNAWYHCGRCGALFQNDPAMPMVQRRCTSCGNPPGSVGMITGRAVSSHTAVTRHRIKHAAEHEDSRKVMNRLLPWIGLAWLLMMGAAFFYVRAKWRIAPEKTDSAPLVDVAGPSAQDVALLNENYPSCVATMQNLVAAGSPEERAQFVLKGNNITSRMVRYYGLNPIVRVDATSLVPLEMEKELLRIGDARMIEARFSADGGMILEALFREQDGSWLVDWDHYVRYSEYPWSLYLTGNGPDEAEFRLLARERFAEGRQNSPSMSLTFYAPKVGYPDETGYQSPEISVLRDSEEGKKLTRAFALAKQGKRPFGATLASHDPSDLIRVRVRVRRSAQEKSRVFEIIKVVACHWYSTDEPGVEPNQR